MRPVLVVCFVSRCVPVLVVVLRFLFYTYYCCCCYLGFNFLIVCHVDCVSVYCVVVLSVLFVLCVGFGCWCVVHLLFLLDLLFVLYAVTAFGVDSDCVYCASFFSYVCVCVGFYMRAVFLFDASILLL